uniref:D-alanyl-D-alanine carboxypeptidase/D-alanyl-D-alanine-endopeptidase n=1 Tax=Prevotella sp. GTC17260 TaxID=3236796 RepID=A0AB33J5F8_9BACT
MTKFKGKAIGKWILLFITMVVCLPLQAQTEDNNTENDELSSATDSTAFASLDKDSIALPWPQYIQHHLDILLESDMLKTSQLGLMVYDLTADSVLYRYNERQTMRPASTMKVITAITVIDKLGGDYRFRTELCYTGKIENRTLSGDVYCVGGLDPRFGTDDLRAFVETLRKMGVDTIRGHLYADQSMKTRDMYGEGWCWDDDNPNLTPLLLSRKDQFMDRFVRELRADSIVVDAFVATAKRPVGTYSICTRFHTIDQILMRMLKESDNLYAESMFYQLSAFVGDQPATAKGSRNVIRQLVSKIGLDPSNYYFADGSGLSLYNYVSAELETMLLRHAYHNNNIYIHLNKALPIAGVDGTLRSRMKGTYTKDNVKAKTGTVKGVSSLAGYCTAYNGHRLCFAILNQGILSHRKARAFQDRICAILCNPN